MKQKKIPCKSCPFRRDNDLNTNRPGGSNPLVYIGQVRGPFWLPCHKDLNYKDKESDPKTVQHCAGAAIFRANIKIPFRLPKEILILPENKDLVFSSNEEFFENYTGIHLPFTEDLLNILLHQELNDKNVRKYT